MISDLQKIIGTTGVATVLAIGGGMFLWHQIGSNVAIIGTAETAIEQGRRAASIVAGPAAEGEAKQKPVADTLQALKTGGGDLSNAAALIGTQVKGQDAAADKTRAEVAGAAAESAARAASAPDTRRALDNGAEVSNAAAIMAAQIANQEAAAQKMRAEILQLQAVGVAALQTIQDMQRKEKLGGGNSTEQNVVLDYQTKQANLATARAQAAVNDEIARAFAGYSYNPDGAFGRLNGQTQKVEVPPVPRQKPAAPRESHIDRSFRQSFEHTPGFGAPAQAPRRQTQHDATRYIYSLGAPANIGKPLNLGEFVSILGRPR